MQFPSDIQAAILLTQPVENFESIVRSFRTLIEAQTGMQFNVPEAKPGVFYRMFGGESINITFEFISTPGNSQVFEQPLGSPITGLLCPDVRERLTVHSAMILINVSHGVLGSVAQEPAIAKMFAEIGFSGEGNNLRQFKQRLDICSLAGRFVCDHSDANLVHWTQSNQLLKPEVFEEAAKMPAPSMLHIHPWLFGTLQDAEEEPKAGIRTFGVRHFLGREVIIQPSVLPWAANYETILAFLRVATTENGYVIPDGDTFGDEDRTQSYRVRYLDAEENDVPLYELTPLFSKEHDFVAEDFAPFENVIDDRSPHPGVMPEDDEAKVELANQWREKRALAEGVGNQFEVRTFDTPPERPTPPSDGSASISGTGLRRKMFGRKGIG